MDRSAGSTCRFDLLNVSVMVVVQTFKRADPCSAIVRLMDVVEQ